MTTGQILNFTSDPIKDKISNPNEASYHYKRFFPSGIQDTVQLNLATDMLTNMNYKSKLDHLNESLQKTTDSSTYITQNRIISSIRNETFPMDSTLERNEEN